MLCTWTTLRKCRAKALTGLTDLGLEKLGFPVREKKRGKNYERFNVTFQLVISHLRNLKNKSWTGETFTCEDHTDIKCVIYVHVCEVLIFM